jgi:hypothetical protein
MTKTYRIAQYSFQSRGRHTTVYDCTRVIRYIYQKVIGEL